MEGRLWALMALLLVPVIHSASLPPAVRSAGLSELVAEAVADYNKGSESEFVFLLLADENDEETEPEEPNEVKFTIKETVCQKSKYKMTERCEYKAGGVEKHCRASIKENHFTVICTTITDGTNKDGGHVAKPSEGERSSQNAHHPLARERTVIIEEKRVNPDRGVGGEEEDTAPREDDDDDDYFLRDTVKEFHDDHDGDVAERRPESKERRAFNRGILGRLLCLKCIIDIFP